MLYVLYILYIYYGEFFNHTLTWYLLALNIIFLGHTPPSQGHNFPNVHSLIGPMNLTVTAPGTLTWKDTFTCAV